MNWNDVWKKQRIFSDGLSDTHIRRCFIVLGSVGCDYDITVSTACIFCSFKAYAEDAKARDEIAMPWLFDVGAIIHVNSIFLGYEIA